jgi:hypothetical protein
MDGIFGQKTKELSANPLKFNWKGSFDQKAQKLSANPLQTSNSIGRDFKVKRPKTYQQTLCKYQIQFMKIRCPISNAKPR